MMPDPFEKFSTEARAVFARAHEEARSFNHNYIGTEHLLLGLLAIEEGVAVRALNSLGVDLPSVRSAIEFIIGRGDGLVVGDPGLTPRAKKVIEFALDEARRMRSYPASQVKTEHLLLGIVREGEGIAAGVLVAVGASLERVRAAVLAELPPPQNDPPVQP